MVMQCMSPCFWAHALLQLLRVQALDGTCKQPVSWFYGPAVKRQTERLLLKSGSARSRAPATGSTFFSEAVLLWARHLVTSSAGHLVTLACSSQELIIPLENQMYAVAHRSRPVVE